MALPTRRLKLTIGTVEFGRGTNYIIDCSQTGLVDEVDGEAGVYRFGCQIVVSEADQDTFLTSCAALEAAFDETNRNKLFKLEIFKDSGVATVHRTYDPASNTGYNARPRWKKTGGRTDLAPLSRRYEVGVVIDLPAPASGGRNGRRTTRWEYTQTDAKRGRLKITGTYTATGANSAYKNYKTSVETYAGTIQTAFGGTWEGPFDVDVRGDEEHGGIVADQIGKVLTFSHTYEELIFNQSSGTLDNVNLRRHFLSISKSIEAPGDFHPSGKAFRLQRYQARYSCSVDKTLTTALATIYESTVKPFLVEQVRAIAGARAMAVTFHEPDLDLVENKIAATATVLAAGNSQIVSSSVETTDDVDEGKELVGRWDGQKFSKEEYDNPGAYVRSVTHEYEVLGGPGGARARGAGSFGGMLGLNRPIQFEILQPSGAEAALDSFFGIQSSGPAAAGGISDQDFVTAGGVAAPDGLRPVLLRTIVTITPKELGEPGDLQLAITAYKKTKIYEFIRDASSKTGGGGGNRGVTGVSGQGSGIPA